MISVKFHEVSLEAHSHCGYDSVMLYDGSSASSPSLGKYCTDNPGKITSNGSSLFIVFTSDGSDHKGGFSLSWSFVNRGGQGWYCYNQCLTMSGKCNYGGVTTYAMKISTGNDVKSLPVKVGTNGDSILTHSLEMFPNRENFKLPL